MSGGIARKPGRPTGRPGHAGQQRKRWPWRKSIAGLVCGGMTGFLIGAAFWVVVGLQELAGSGAAMLSPLRDPQGGHAPRCTSLALDRYEGHTTAEPCLREALPLREARATGLGGRSVP